MNEERVRQIVRQFPENGLKQILRTGGNIRELLSLGDCALLSRGWYIIHASTESMTPCAGASTRACGMMSPA